MVHTHEEHRNDSPRQIQCAVVTISDTRTLETDVGGQRVTDYLEKNEHLVSSRDIIRDEPAQIRQCIVQLCDRPDIDAILLTGGTGISSRDTTYETITQLLTQTLPGYGELFRMRSWEQIGAAAMLSRAVGGLVGTTVVLTMPGSPAAVDLAMEELVLPELAHLVREARR